MDLDTFLEKDIILFLENKKGKKAITNIDREDEYGLYLSKDYLKELEHLLEKDEITEAQKLFDELRDHYNKLPKGSLEGKKVYSILEQMYSKIQTYLKLRYNMGSMMPFDEVLSSGFGGTSESEGGVNLGANNNASSIERRIDLLSQKLMSCLQDVRELKIVVSKSNSTSQQSPSRSQTLSSIQTLERQSNVPKYIPKKELSQIEKSEIEKNILESPLFKKPLTEPEAKKPTRIPEETPKLPDFNLKKEPETITTVPVYSQLKEDKIREIKLFKVPRRSIDRTEVKSGMIPGMKPIMVVNTPLTTSSNISSNIYLNDSSSDDSVIEDRASTYNESETFKDLRHRFSKVLMSKKRSIPKKVIGLPKPYHEKIYSEALDAMNKGNYVHASRLFSKVLKIHPHHTASRIRLKQCGEAMHHV